MDVLKEDVAAFIRKAEQSFSRNESLFRYEQALELCRRNDGLVEERALISSNCAEVCLKLQLYDRAITYAEECIGLNPNSHVHEGYLVRAKARMKALDSPRYTVKASPGYANVIQDYIHSHRLKQNASAFCEAILLAVNHGHSHLIEPVMQTQDHEFSKKLFQELLFRRKATAKHFELVMKCTPPFDASQVQLSELLKKQFTDKNSIEMLFEMGMKVKKVDIELAVKLLPESNIDTLNLLVSNCSSNDFDEACKEAIRANRDRFTACLGAVSSNPLAIVSGLEDIVPKRKIDLICFFMEQGTVDCTLLSNPLHVATKLAVEADGDTRAIRAVVKAPAFIKAVPKDGRIVDSKKQTPIHLAVISVKKSTSHKILLTLAESQIPINPFVKDKRGKQARDYINKQDSRNKDLENAARIFHSLTGGIGKGKKKKSRSDSDSSPLVTPDSSGIATLNKTPSNTSQSKTSTEVASIEEKPNMPQSKAESSMPEGIEESDMSDSTSEKLNMPESKEPEEVSNMHEEPSCNDELENKKEKQCMPTGKEESCVRQESNKHEGSLSSASKKTTASIEKDSIAKRDYEQLTLQEKLAKQLNRIYANRAEYFTAPPMPSSEGERFYDQASDTEKEQSSSEKVPEAAPISATPSQPECAESEEENTGFSLPDALLGLCIDDLPWEVEISKQAFAFFKDSKKYPQALRLNAARTIYRLAEGKRDPKIYAKPVGASDMHIYRAKFGQKKGGGRILWQKAIQFSSRLTANEGCNLYTQVIRVWSVVPHHDRLSRTISQIESSYKRGEQATTCHFLLHQELMQPKKEPAHVVGGEAIEFPMIFIDDSSDCQSRPDVQIQRFVPAASLKEGELNVTTFYPFSNNLIKSSLKCTNKRLDFPFKVWSKEHEIISLDYTKPILLLGRSGTGKTTCCLYRLWNEFKNFWDPTVRHDYKSARKTEVERTPVSVTEDPAEENNPPCTQLPFEDGCSQSTYCHSLDSRDQHELKEFPEQVVTETNTTADSDSEERPELIEEEQEDDWSKSYSPDSYDQHGLKEQVVTERNTTADSDSEERPELVEEEQEDDSKLHQVFVTKNYVLCDQVKKFFYNLAEGHEFLAEHMKYEAVDVPNSLDKIEDHHYPLFLTARQFYILLDNSLEEEKFFPRDAEGHMKYTIESTDYDHEDFGTLLDLEESEDEEEEDIMVHSHSLQQRPSRKQSDRWVEVTSLYFEKNIWPDISHQCGAKGLDPILVWTEIQSFIKGSEEALRNNSHLSFKEYQAVGRSKAPKFVEQRNTIFKAFECYQKYCQNQRHSIFLFDECDLVQSLYKRLCKAKDVPWSIHSFYIDEVQDFTQLELATFLCCCRDPNSMFFTGDTAQSIMRGIVFRFQDLQSCFYRLNKFVPEVQVPEKPYILTTNFRSHSGVLHLASSVIDLLQEFFKDSVDYLPKDKGMFQGPTPILIESCEVSDLALLLSANKRESSTIEFGAHQAIVVRSKHEVHPMLQGAIVLTIFEAKGLEFDDVLLYNFFKDSPVDEKRWRVVTSYLEKHPESIKNETPLPGSDKDPRSLEFSEQEHKSLDAEFKYLYTAITRAKCNLWIYDSDEEKRRPMFDYWHKLALAKAVRNDQDCHSFISACTSTPEQWKAQGDNFKKKHLWEQAIHCYEKSDPTGNAHLIQEVRAWFLLQQAKKPRAQDYVNAAVCFLESDSLHHDTKCISNGLLCTMKANPNKHMCSKAAKLFERLNEDEHAFVAYKRAGEITSCVRLREKAGRYKGALKLLIKSGQIKDALHRATEYAKQGILLPEQYSIVNLSHLYISEKSNSTNRLQALQHCADLMESVDQYGEAVRILDEYKVSRIEALKRATQYEERKGDIHLPPRLSASALAYRYAKNAVKQQDSKELEKILEYMTDIQTKVRILKEGGPKFHRRRFSIYKKERQYKEAFRLAFAQKWYSDGVSLAREAKDSKMEARFIFQQGWHYIYYGSHTGRSETLKALHNLKKSQASLIRAEACLLLGIIEQDISLCQAARRSYKFSKHNVGELEAFNAIAKLTRKEDIRSVLKACQLAHSTANSLRKQGLDESASTTLILQQAAEFYCLHKIGDLYYTSPKQPPWICGCPDIGKDYDGMMKYRISEVRVALAGYLSTFVTEWLKNFEVQHKLECDIKSFEHQHKLPRDKSLGLSRAFEVPRNALKEYIVRHIQMLELRQLEGNDCTDTIIQLLSVFSPQFSVYLPLNKIHLPVQCSHLTYTVIHNWIASTIQEKENESVSGRTSIDPWLNMWRACCLTDGNVDTLNSSVKDLAKRINTEVSTLQDQMPTQYNAPPAFFLWRKENKYYHIFFFWLRSCELIKEGEALWSSKCAIDYFLSSIANSNGVYISVMNLVDILSIHCTSLLAMISYSDFIKKSSATQFIVPLLYKHTVQVFNHLNCHVREDMYALSASMKEVEQRRNSSRNLDRLKSDCSRLLWRALDIILGVYNYKFSLLSFTMKQERATKSSANRQLLILALTLFGNLLLTQTLPPKTRDLAFYRNKFVSILKKSWIQESGIPEHASRSIPQYIHTAYQCCISPQFTSQMFFPLLEYLLLEGEPNAGATLARFPIYHKHRINFVEIPCQIPRRPRHAISQPHLQQNLPQSTSTFTSYASAAAASSPFTPVVSSPRLVVQEHATLQQSPHSQANLADNSSHFISPDTIQGSFPTPVPSCPSGAVVSVLPNVIQIGEPAVTTTVFRFDAESVQQYPMGTVLPPLHAQYHPQIPPQQSETEQLPSLLQPTVSVESIPVADNQHQPQLTYSFESQPSVNVTTSSSSVLQQPDPEVAPGMLSVNGTHTQTDIPINTSNEQEEFRMEGELSEPEYSRNDSYSENEEPIEYDQTDEDVIHILSHPVQVQKTVELVDNTLADENFCTACRLTLRAEIKREELMPKGETEEAEETGLDDEVAPADVEDVDKCIETYHSHIKSRSHQENVKLYQKFTSELQWHYEPLMDDLIKELEHLEGEVHVDGDPLLAKRVDEIKDEKETIETKAEDLRSNYSWKDAIGEITEMADKIQSLLNRASATRKQEHQSAAEPVQSDLKTSKLDLSDEEQEEDLKPTPEDHGAKLREPRTREQKLRSRQKKIMRGRVRK